MTFEALVAWLNNGKMAKNKTTLDKIAYTFVENGDSERIIGEVTDIINKFNLNKE